MHENDTSGVFYARHRAEPADDYRSGPVSIAFGAVLVLVLAACCACLIGLSLGMYP